MIVIGNDDESMVIAANALRQSGGGLVAVENGDVLALMALPFGGLMSLKSVDDAAGELTGVENALKQIGCPHDSAGTCLRTCIGTGIYESRSVPGTLKSSRSSGRHW